MADLADIARGLEAGLTGYLTQEAREREEERRAEREERREEEHEARMRRNRNQRILSEAEAASRGVELEGVEQTRQAGPQATLEGRDVNVTDVPRHGLEARPTEQSRFRESPVPVLTGDESLMGEDQQLRGMATGRPELEPTDAGPDAAGPMASALQEEFSRAAQAPPGAEPDVEAGAIDPETGTFAQDPVYRGGKPTQESDVGRLLRGEGEIEQRGPTYRLSGGQTFRPGEQGRRELRRQVDRILEARPDLTEAEAELLARGESGALTFGRGQEEGLDETYNIRGREFTDQDRAVAAHEAFEGGGRGAGGSRTQKEHLAVQYGFTEPDGSPDLAGYERFQERVGSLQDVYGNTQGDPVLQKSLEARAMGLSETEVLNRLTSQAREQGYSDAEIQQLRQDVRGFFAQRSRRQIQRLEEGDLSGPNFGSGFDLQFSAPSDSAASGGGGGGVGPLRGGGGR